MTDLTNECVSTTNLTTNERYDLVASDRRRLAIHELAKTGEAVELATLAETLARRETGDDAPSPDTVMDVAVALHHFHLPKLARSGVLAYDSEAHVVDPCDLTVKE